MSLNLNLDSWFWKFALLFAVVGVRFLIPLLAQVSVSLLWAKAKNKHTLIQEATKWTRESYDSAAIAIGLVLLVIQPFILQSFWIPSSSMEDTLQINDRLLVSKLIYRFKDPQFQDVVVFKAPPEAKFKSENPKEEVDFIKRCMGVAGDVVEVKDRKVYRNGKLIPEPYVKWSEAAHTSELAAPDALGGEIRFSYDMKIYGGAVYSREYIGPHEVSLWTKNDIVVPDADQEAISAAAPGKVPAGKFLMLGDHRNRSNDGHVWGFVPRANIVGKAICVFWPLGRLGLVDNMSVNQTPKE